MVIVTVVLDETESDAMDIVPFKTLADIIERDVRVVIADLLISDAVILNDDLDTVGEIYRTYCNSEIPGVIVDAVLSSYNLNA